MGLQITKVGKAKRPRRGEAEVPSSRPFNALSRVSIQLSRLPFHSLDPKSASQTELALDFAVGQKDVVWEVAGDWDPETKSRNPAMAGPLPGPHARSILVALGRCWNATPDIAKRDMGHVASRTFKLSILELFDLMGQTPSGRAYEILRETVKRMKSVTITTNGGWKEDGEWVNETIYFNLVDEARIVERQHSPDGGQVVFTLSHRVAKALVQHSRLLDSGAFQRLENHTAKALYMLLDAERFTVDHRGESELRAPLAWLRERLAISSHTTKEIKKVLDRAHTELVREGYLAPVEYVEALPDDYTRFPSRPGSKSKSVAALYRILAGRTPEKKMPALPVAEAAERLGHLGIVLEPDTLERRIARVVRVTGDEKNWRTFKRPCELLSLEDFDRIVNTIDKDKSPSDSPRVLGATFNSRAKHLLDRSATAATARTRRA